MTLQLEAVLAANEAYRQGAFHTSPRTPQPVRHLIVLTCMDARLDLFRSLGLEVGDAHILRNAGGRASEDAIRSLVVSAHMLGTREIGVIHHTNCGLEGVTEEEVAERTGVRDMTFLAFPDARESVRDDVDRIAGLGQMPAEMVVWGAVYDVDSGALEVVAPPQAVGTAP